MIRRFVTVVLTALSLVLVFATPVTATNEDPHKVIVCKYVGQPGVSELVQTGDNPIQVDEAALEGEGFTGEFPFPFEDAQGGSLAIRFAENEQDKGDISECPVPPPDVPDLDFSDCTEPGESGSITIEGLDEGVTVRVNGPTVGTFDEDGTYPLLPGHYGYRVVFDGEPLDQGTFDIGECPPPPPPPSVPPPSTPPSTPPSSNPTPPETDTLTTVAAEDNGIFGMAVLMLIAGTGLLVGSQWVIKRRTK